MFFTNSSIYGSPSKYNWVTNVGLPGLSGIHALFSVWSFMYAELSSDSAIASVAGDYKRRPNSSRLICCASFLGYHLKKSSAKRGVVRKLHKEVSASRDAEGK